MFFKIDPVISLLPVTHGQYIILALSLPICWLRVTFVLNILVALRVIYASDIAKRLSINAFVILWI